MPTSQTFTILNKLKIEKTMKFILNIGMHKTGTSAIQQSFSGFFSDHAAYLDMPNPNHSAILMTMFMENPQNYSDHNKNMRSAVEVEALKTKFTRRFLKFCAMNSGKDVVSSGEDIINLPEDKLREMKEWLSVVFDDFLIIGYVRPPISFMVSSLQQRVAGGINAIKPEQMYPNYRQKFEKFDNVFGKDRVLLTKFDRGSLLDGDVVLDFASKADVEFSKKDIVVANVGRSLEATAVAYVQRSQGSGFGRYPKSPRDNSAFIQKLSELGTSKIKLHTNFVEDVLQHHKADLDWVTERLGVDFIDSACSDADALQSLDHLREIAASHLPQITRLLADEAADDIVKDPQLVADTADILKRIIRAKREQNKTIFDANRPK